MSYAAAFTNESDDGVRQIKPLWLTLWMFVGLVALVSLLAIAVSTYMTAPEYTPDRSTRQIVIGNDSLAIPANFIRFDYQRNASTLKQVDLYFHWPTGEGFSERLRQDFTKSNLEWDLMFASINQRQMPLDMTGRIDQIYRDLFVEPSQGMTHGLTIQPLDSASAYANEVLYYEEGVASPYAVRCVAGREGVYQANCLRDINIGQGLSLTYRFPAKFIAQWRQIESLMTAKANAYLN